MSIISRPESGKILGLDGKPIQSFVVEKGNKRYAIVGTVNVHAAVFELDDNKKMADAIQIQQRMVETCDPKLKDATQSMVFFWAEDDDTRDHNRQTLLMQLLAFFKNLNADGTFPMPKDSFELTDEMLGRTEKGTGDETPSPDAA